jgi:pyruvate formate lyase activating enzyme
MNSILSQNKKFGKGLIFNMQRFSLHDGPGIRTLIFFKGCSLRCEWCSNPEGQSGEIQLFFDRRKCSLCLECLKVCPKNANRVENKKIIHDRDLCKFCGKCISTCFSEARNLSGKWITVPEIIEALDKDEVFFRNSGGGVTLGGGEPTFQYDFIRELLNELKKYNINTAIETCGFLAWGKLEVILDKIDWVIFDLKHINDEKHKKYTSVSNRMILENLEKLLKVKKNVIVRLTVVPGFNDSKAEKEMMVSFIRSLDRDVCIDFLPYHEYGKFKYALIDREYEFNKVLSL